jgi:hypothetical protein
LPPINPYITLAIGAELVTETIDFRLPFLLSYIMDADTARSGKGLKRQRKPHRKSRMGCQNCKLRSVKCDEAKPGCERCATSGFTCSYTASSSRCQALELAHKGSFTVLLEKPAARKTVVAELAAPNPHITIPAVPSWATRGDHFELSQSDIRLLHDFHKMVFHRMGSPLARDRCASFMQSLATQVSLGTICPNSRAFG